ncbi:hypothetical protein QBC44DRAFT_313654 [Cladorrhinum sp. PSN332]|nr:hypothetical protein QBC44DRAFT_313654 [Cladorrhinum sp. PSN332]
MRRNKAGIVSTIKRFVLSNFALLNDLRTESEARSEEELINNSSPLNRNNNNNNKTATDKSDSNERGNNKSDNEDNEDSEDKYRYYGGARGIIRPENTKGGRGDYSSEPLLP